MSRPAATRLSGETREGIVLAALRVFTEKGYDGASTRLIAAEARVNHGLIPYYFGTKEKLWREAVNLAFEDVHRGIQIAQEDSSIRDDRERAARMIRTHVQFIARRPEFVRLMYEEGKRRGPRMRWLVDRHVKPVYDAWAPLIERLGMKGGPLSGIAPVHFFYILAGSTGLIFHQAEECRRVSGVDPFDPAVVEEHARVVELLLLGPARPAAKSKTRK